MYYVQEYIHKWKTENSGCFFWEVGDEILEELQKYWSYFGLKLGGGYTETSFISIL